MTTTQSGRTVNVEAAEQFAHRMLEVLNDGALALMLSIGYRTGLFDVLDGLSGPATSQLIADLAELDERYVREWLGAMTTAGVTRHDSHALTYWLPAEHAPSLTGPSSPDNLARIMQLIGQLALVELPVVDRFRHGGGLSYSDFPEFHALMAQESAAVFDTALVDVVLPLVPGIRQRLTKGIDVADIGCGSGHAINVLAKAFPKSRFTGYDFAEEAIARARAEADEHGLGNARFELQDVAELAVLDCYDLVTSFDAIHDQARPADVLSRIGVALRSGGTFLMADMKASSDVNDNLDSPFGPFLYTVSTLHCMAVSLGQGGAGLGAAWGHQLATRMLNEAGFASVELKELEQDPFNYYYLARKV